MCLAAVLIQTLLTGNAALYRLKRSLRLSLGIEFVCELVSKSVNNIQATCCHRFQLKVAALAAPPPS